ncbi:MAG TPA: hypothetical protein VKB86_14760 [Pyrinomonadaceae bacterium]|nr:hypothetical protein [Pyrinomonadaceae bacterium]
MPSKKELRKTQKIEKKRTNIALNQSQQKALGLATNTAVAIGKIKSLFKTYHTRSGDVGRRGGMLHGTATHKYPWSLLTPSPHVPHSFINCAEAQMYLRIVEVGGDPKDFTITSYDRNLKINPPCDNCKKWVYNTFKKVVDS